jgi:WD40 repeat protein
VPDWVTTIPTIDENWGACFLALENHDSARDVAFSLDGQLLASVSAGMVRIWDVATGACQHILKAYSQWISSAFSPNGQLLTFSNYDIILQFWDLATGTCQQTLSFHGDPASPAAFSPNCQLLALVSSDNTICTWELAPNSFQRLRKGHESYIRLLKFSPSSLLLASSDDFVVRIWDLASGICRQTLSFHDAKSLVFSPSDQLLFLALSSNVRHQWTHTPMGLGREIQCMPAVT